MWEFIAFVLLGFVMLLVGAAIHRSEIVNRSKFEFKGQLYRVTKIEDKD